MSVFTLSDLRSRLPAVGPIAGALSLLLASPCGAQDNSTSGPSLSWFGDLRLRFEQDWDSQTASGAPREDRARGRIRARVGANIDFGEDWSGGIRLRTGNSRSQQSPHLTFLSDSGGTDDLDGLLDKYFVRYGDGTRSVWLGRNSFPFWQQNEFFWDDDVTPTGLAASFKRSDSGGEWTTTLGAFALPDGGWGLNGSLASGQVKYRSKASEGEGQLTFALGLHRFFGEAGADELLHGNGARDYLIANFGAQWQGELDGRRLTLGLDVFKNFEGYSAAELLPYSAEHEDQDFGYVASAQLGQLKESGDWQFGYYYARIETFAVNASFAQDDWVRFGTATQTAGSDCQGHEARLSYAITPTLNLVGRAFFVESITSIQDGNRFRIDLNWKY